MVEAIRHESFYTTGTWSDEGLGVYVGWVARRGSFSDGMPLRDGRGDVTLIFSGEESSGSYMADGAGRGSADERPYLIERYERDADFPASLNGRFQGIVLDRAHGTATLFNDRYGMNRIHFHESKDAFYFAAEAKAILAVRPELRAMAPKAMGEFVSFGCVLEDRTFFQGVFVVPAASAWKFCNGELKERASYFQAQEWEEQTPLGPDEYYRELRQAFTKNLSRYFNGREPVGLALTGGLDTRTIMAWRKAAPGSLPCYTYGGSRRDCQDVRIARSVAGLTRQPYEVIELGDDFLSRFRHYAERTTFLAEGCVDVSNAPDLYFSEKARQIAPIKIVGTWGSEILQHLVTFKPTAPTEGLFRPELLSRVSEAEATYRRLRREHPVTIAAFLQARWHHHGIFGLEETQLGVRCPFLDNEVVRTVYRAPTLNGAADVRLRLIGEGDPIIARLRSDRGVGQDSNGIRERASRFLQELAFKAEYGYDYGMPNWAARIDHLLSPLPLDRLFLGRHKFSHFRVWYRDELSQTVRDVLLDPQALSRPYLERGALESIVRGHLRGAENHTLAIHKLMTLELLHRLFA
jgi:asparagine synthase (glutamine-hydrolysing)